MSLEIDVSTGPPKNNGSEPQPLLATPQTYSTVVQDKEGHWFVEMRGWIMIVAVQVAAATYASGLSPPGGFWPDDHDDHTAGYAILHDKSKHRYTTFYYANATAFMASLVIIVLLMNEKFYGKRSRVVVLNIFVVLGLVSLMISYAAGSARKLSTSIYVIILAVGVLLFVLFSESVLQYIVSLIAKWFPFFAKIVGPELCSMLTSEKDKGVHDESMCTTAEMEKHDKTPRLPV